MTKVLWGGGWRTTGPLGHKEWQSRWQAVEKMELERLTRAPSLGLVMLGASPSRALLCENLQELCYQKRLCFLTVMAT